MGLGYSYPMGKEEIKQILLNYLNPGDRILDVGPGGGTYRHLLGDGFEWDAVEIWPPAVTYCETIYDHVYPTDIRDFEYEHNYDLIIFGDVLEHLVTEDAWAILNEAQRHTKCIMVAVPYELPQPALDGNEAEIHRQPDLTPEIMAKRYPNLTSVVEIPGSYGYYMWCKGVRVNDIK